VRRRKKGRSGLNDTVKTVSSKECKEGRLKMKTCKTCLYNVAPSPTQCKSCDKNTFSNYVFKSNCFGNYNFRIIDCQRQDNTTCVECKYRKEIADLKDKLHFKDATILEIGIKNDTLKKQLAEAKDTISRRNAQITDLRGRIPNYKWKCFNCGTTFRYSDNPKLKDVTPSCFCSKPSCELVVIR
jgi:hypothetical protein